MKMGNEQTVDIEPALRKKPKLVWVISIFYILSAGYTILSFVLISTGAIQVNEAQKAYFDSQSIFDDTLTLTMGSLNVLGAIFLLLLMRYAYHCFLTAFSLGIVMYVYHIIFKNWLGAIGGPGLVGAVIGWLISIAIILYSKKLIKKEILK
jgi:hypothetical protein